MNDAESLVTSADTCKSVGCLPLCLLLIHQQQHMVAPQRAASYFHVQSSRAPTQSRRVPLARQKSSFVPPSGEISPSAITVHLSKTLARDRATLFLLGEQRSVKIQPEPDHSPYTVSFELRSRVGPSNGCVCVPFCPCCCRNVLKKIRVKGKTRHSHGL